MKNLDTPPLTALRFPALASQRKQSAGWLSLPLLSLEEGRECDKNTVDVALWRVAGIDVALGVGAVPRSRDVFLPW